LTNTADEISRYSLSDNAILQQMTGNVNKNNNLGVAAMRRL